jgi:hypothetical protein
MVLGSGSTNPLSICYGAAQEFLGCVCLQQRAAFGSGVREMADDTADVALLMWHCCCWLVLICR